MAMWSETQTESKPSSSAPAARVAIELAEAEAPLFPRWMPIFTLALLASSSGAARGGRPSGEDTWNRAEAPPCCSAGTGWHPARSDGDSPSHPYRERQRVGP